MPKLSDIQEKQTVKLADIQDTKKLSDIKDDSVKLSDIKPDAGEIRSTETVTQENRKPRNLLEKTIDVMQRGQFAVENPLLEQIRGAKKGDIMSGVSPFASPEKTVEFLKNAKAGFTGEKRVMGSDILSELGWKPTSTRENVAKSIVGLGLDIGLDPLTYVGIGAATKASKTGRALVSFMGEPVIEGEKILKRLDVMGDAFKNTGAGKLITKLFVKTTGNKELDALIDKNLGNRYYLQSKAIDYGVGIRKEIKKLSKTSKVAEDVINSEVVRLVESGGDEVIKGTKNLASKLTTKFEDILKKEQEAGLDVYKLYSENGINYFPRITTKDAEQYLKKATVGKRGVWNADLANSLKRKTGDFTIEEFNQFVAENGLKSLGGKKVQEFFMKEPSYASAIRGVRSAKAVTTAEFVDDIIKKFGKSIDDAPGHYELMGGRLPKQFPKLQNIAFDPEIIENVNRYYFNYSDETASKAVLKAWDATTNWWKSWSLNAFPAYHARNISSNLYNNSLAGVLNPASYGKAGLIQNYRKFGKSWITGKLDTKYADEIIEQAEKHGVLGSGWYGAEIPEEIEKRASGFLRHNKVTAADIISKEAIVNKAGRAVGTTLENNARLAHFIDKVSKGYSYEEAAESVKKFLFDYSDLSDFERKVMKRILPFYTWSRKNIPLQVEMMIKMPGRALTPMFKLKDELAGGKIDEMDKLPEWLKKRFALRIGDVKDGFGSYMPLEGYIAGTDLAKLGEFWNIPLEQMNPIIKYPLEQLLNYNIYFKQPIAKISSEIFPMGEPVNFMRLEMPARIVHTMRYFRLLNEVDKLIGKSKTKEDLTPLEKGVRVFTGIKIYKQDLNKLRRTMKWQLDQQEKEIKSQIRWAGQNDRKEAVKELSNALKQLTKMRYKYQG